MTIIEKIIANHSIKKLVAPGEIVDIVIDVKLARDFGGANVVKNLIDNQLKVQNPENTFFTFDCNPTGSDQKYAANQQACRIFARENLIKVYDIDAGIGTHLAIDKGLAVPGCTLVSTDSHANIVGAIGAFGQGMGDKDIAAAWANGSVWFKVPETVKITLTGKRNPAISAKDIILNLLKEFGANTLLGHTVELYGNEVEKLTLDERITIASMATEMGAIAILIPPSLAIVELCKQYSGKSFNPVYADQDANYKEEFILDIESFINVVSLPGKPHNVVNINFVKGTLIDSVFVGSCTNGRLEDLQVLANILKGKKVKQGVVLKIVPATNTIWDECLQRGWISIFKESGALVGNAGCAGCASGQIGQNGPGEVTLSTGNRNFAGKQGKGDVYLVSPEVAATSAINGYLSLPSDGHLNIERVVKKDSGNPVLMKEKTKEVKPGILEGKIWIVDEDNIDTDMIFHNQHLAITKLNEMGQHAFGNLHGWEDYPQKCEPGDIIITGKNFGAGSSRQQAVDCFIALGTQLILAQSFGAIYERNAINAGFPVLSYESFDSLELKQRDVVQVDLVSGQITNKRNNKDIVIQGFSEVQLEIYKRGGLLIPKGDFL